MIRKPGPIESEIKNMKNTVTNIVLNTELNEGLAAP